jgi:hypothetical protein
MIVTSKRCFLNVMTQMCDAEVLLNAMYYIGDVNTPQDFSSISQSIGYSEDGQIIAQPTFGSSISRYVIEYMSDLLSPTPYVTTLLSGIGSFTGDCMKDYINHLNKTETLLDVYSKMIKPELRGNGLQILIFVDEENVKRFAHIVCEYLAHNFGLDISFVDPIYRPNVIGRAEYHGDKAFAMQNIKDLRDAQLILNFNTAISMSCGDSTCSNLTAFLCSMNTVPELIYLYNLLFPNDPLPPDNYNVARLRDIIVGRISSSIPQFDGVSNMASTRDFLAQLEKYDAEIE